MVGSAADVFVSSIFLLGLDSLSAFAQTHPLNRWLLGDPCKSRQVKTKMLDIYTSLFEGTVKETMQECELLLRVKRVRVIMFCTLWRNVWGLKR